VLPLELVLVSPLELELVLSLELELALPPRRKQCRYPQLATGSCQ